MKTPWSRVANTPVTMQMEGQECGVACLRMILAGYGKYVSMAELRIVCGTGISGTGVKRIMKSAIHYGLNCDAYSMTAAMLPKETQFPMILYWQNRHFVVLCGFSCGKAVINDPDRGRIRIPMEELEKNFSGLAIFFTPGEHFVKGGKHTELRDFVLGTARKEKKALLFLALINIVTVIVAFFQSGFSRVFLDRMLDSNFASRANLFLLGFLAIAVVQVVAICLYSRHWLKFQGKMASASSAGFLWHMLNLPIQFFIQRQTGDLLMRRKANENIASALVSKLVPLVMNIVLIVLYLTVMFRYSIPLTVIGIGLILLNILVSTIAAKVRVNDTRASSKLSSTLCGMTISGIGMAESLKACGAETHYFTRWAADQAASNRQNVENGVRSIYLSAVSDFFRSLTNIMVLVCGMQLIGKGQFTVGMLMAYQGLTQSLMVPVLGLTTARQDIKEMRTDMERTEDVMQYPRQTILHDGETDAPCKEKLSGAISIRNVSFGYCPMEKKQIKDFSLEIRPGEKIAIVGASGCGKSTLCKLLTGLYAPSSGEILFDGYTAAQIDRTAWCESLSIVEPEGKLFHDTVMNNLCMWDDKLPPEEVMEAAKTAMIHDEIIARPGAYDYVLNTEKSDFSGGQRQRLAIARALVRRPSILILDEATSALDAGTEAELLERLYARNITIITVAHRLSTIRNCDRILVLDKGSVVESGTHDSLMAQNGLYRHLIESN